MIQHSINLFLPTILVNHHILKKVKGNQITLSLTKITPNIHK